MTSKTPTNLGNDVTTVLRLNAYAPTDPLIPKITRVVAFAFPLVEIPPFSIPADKNTRPTNMVKPESACMPVRNVFAMPM